MTDRVEPMERGPGRPCGHGGGDGDHNLSKEEVDKLLEEDDDKEKRDCETISLSSGGVSSYRTTKTSDEAAGGGSGPTRAYATIRAAKAATMRIRCLGTGSVSMQQAVGGLATLKEIPATRRPSTSTATRPQEMCAAPLTLGAWNAPLPSEAHSSLQRN
jgi:hypothetical protein